MPAAPDLRRELRGRLGVASTARCPLIELVADSRREGRAARREVGEVETEADAEAEADDERCALLLVGERERDRGDSGGEVGIG